jgi:signal peptide peptidase SppA
VFSGVISRWAQGITPSEEVMAGIAADREARSARAQTNSSAGGGSIAVLPLYGIVTQRGNMADNISGPGSVSTQAFAAALRDALNDESVGSVLIDIDSPGGSVYGVGELADLIYQARGQKPVVALANSLAASAAYWIGCAASEFYVTPSGEVGSIGVGQAHVDQSQALAAEGIKPTLISAGKFKVEGNPYQPLDDEARAFMQSRVDDYYASFIKGVARGRGVPLAQVRDGMGQGRVLGADAALAENMVDGIMTFDQVIKKMQKEARAAAASRGAPANRLAAARLSIMGA